MNDYILFVDTETSGIPESINTPLADLERWPFILQLAWLIYDKEGQLIKTENRYIFEEDISIQKSSVKIHGITLDDLKKSGEDRKSVIRSFVKDLRQYKPLIVGHFVEFDSKMLQAAMLRSGVKNHMKDYWHFCTMRATSEYTRMPMHDYPKLDELYEGLFDKKLKHHHDAFVDAEATARCFFELFNRGELTEQLINVQPLFSKMTHKVSQKTGCGLQALLIILSILWWIL